MTDWPAWIQFLFFFATISAGVLVGMVVVALAFEYIPRLAAKLRRKERA